MFVTFVLIKLFEIKTELYFCIDKKSRIVKKLHKLLEMFSILEWKIFHSGMKYLPSQHGKISIPEWKIFPFREGKSQIFHTHMELFSLCVIELKHSLQQTVSILVETKNKLENTEQTLTSKLAQTEKELEKIKKQSIPIGFTYVQLPKDKAPKELWPSLTWTDVSSEYEGVFFRVVGGGAGSFGVVQQENAPRLETIHTGFIEHRIKNVHGDPSNNVSIPVTG